MNRTGFIGSMQPHGLSVVGADDSNLVPNIKPTVSQYGQFCLR